MPQNPTAAVSEPPLDADRPRPADVAVIGSGAAGLAASWRLHRAGHRVKLFERGDYLGGRIRTLHRDGFLIEEGPTQMVRSYTTILGIIEEAGMAGDVIPASSLLGMLDAQRHTHNFSIEHVYRDMATTGLLTVREKLDLGKLAFDVLRHRRKLDPEDLTKLVELDHLSAEEYGRGRLNSSVFDNFVDPVVRGFTGTSPDKVSASDLLWVLATFMNAQHFVALRGGMSSYPAHLSRHFDCQLNAPVVEVVERADHVEVTWREAGGERTETFRGAVIATQPKPAAEIHTGLDPWRREFLAEHVGHTTIVAVHVALERAPAPPASMIYSTEVSALTPVLAVGLEHNKVPAHVPAGKGVATIYADGVWSRELLEQDDETVTRKLIEAGAAFVPGVGDGVLFTQVVRWPYAWFQSYPGYWQQMCEFRRRSRETDRLVHLAGDYFCTTSLNVASTAGERAARDLLAAVPVSA
jgi:protoporphyrinogen/coproporphyrinogen III oxidase